MYSTGLFNSQSTFSSAPISIKQPKLQRSTSNRTLAADFRGRTPGRKTATRCSNGGRRTFLTLEEAGLVEISGLSTHEKFLCRLTISSLNLLRVIAEQEGKKIEELNAGDLCDWFLKDKLKREQDMESAVLQWDDSEILL
uniref:Uncharacterized protein n=1 Tax=Kalanchoe fedtschenkoi TaxID=63787 RepID=A0A7N0V2R5_KALFE